MTSRDGNPWRNPSMLGTWRPSQHYSGAGNFEACGLDAVVHMECRMNASRSHKIEILRMGDKTYDDAIALTKRLFVCDPDELDIMRTDLTADIAGVPVDWFKRHAFIRAKQTRRELGTIDAYQMVTKGRAGTLYGGVKPEQVRIYDKGSEREMQYDRYLRRFLRLRRELPDSVEVEPTSFLAMYGHERGKLITRVERQVSGRGLASLDLSTMNTLLNGTELDPFRQIVFYESSARGFPELAERNWRKRCIGEALTHRVQTLGLSDTLSWMKASLGKNFHRAKKDFEAYLCLADNVVGIDAWQLRNSFRASTLRQLRRAA